MRFRPLCAVAFSLVAASVAPALAQKTAPEAKTITLKPGPSGQVMVGKVQVAPPPGLVLFNKALAETRLKHYAQAERLYLQLLKTEPGAPSVWANLGLLQAYQGRIAEAEKSFTNAVQKAPQTPIFRAQLASLQFRQGKLPQAASNARLALKTDAKNPIALATLADVYMAQQKFADALPPLRTLRGLQGSRPDDRTEIGLILALNGTQKHSEALTLARKRVARLPKSSQAYLILGDTLRLSGDVDAARNAYAYAQRLDPKSPGAAVGLSLVAAQSGDRRSLQKLLDKQIESHPNDARLFFQRGQLLYTEPDTSAPDDPARLKRLAQAEQDFYRAATLDPKNPLFFTYTGAAAMLQGEERYQAADAMFRAALNLAPRTTLARMGLAYLAERQGKGKDALAQYQAILQYAPKDNAARRGVAGIFYATGEKDKAYKEMRAIALDDKRDTRILNELGSWLVQDKRYVEATAVYDQVLMRDPRDEGAYLALGNIAQLTNDVPLARQRYRDTLKAIPGSERAALLLGQSLLQDGKNGPDGKPDATALAATSQAIQVFQAQVTANPTSSQTRWQLAVLLHRLGRDDEALQQMRQIRLVQGDPNRSTYLLGAPRLLIEEKKYPEAITLLRELAQENPHDDELQYVLADALGKSGQIGDAEAVLTRLRDSRSQTGAAPPLRPLLALGQMYEQANRADEAATAYEEALRRDPTNLVALYGLDRVRTQQGKANAARTWLEDLVFANPKEPLFNAIGSVQRLYSDNKNTAGFADFTKRLVEKYPDDWSSQYLRARVITDPTMATVSPAARQEAVSLYGRLLVRDPKNVEAKTQLATQYEALGQKNEAIAIYRALLGQNKDDTNAKEGLRRLGASLEVPAPAPKNATGGSTSPASPTVPIKP